MPSPAQAVKEQGSAETFSCALVGQHASLLCVAVLSSLLHGLCLLVLLPKPVCILRRRQLPLGCCRLLPPLPSSHDGRIWSCLYKPVNIARSRVGPTLCH